ncbi:hypothetical protein NHP21011_07540 [Helicobacter heilmannii]|nr:hypothetical protein NHP21011_07540 [Helicobacter heilmannii]
MAHYKGIKVLRSHLKHLKINPKYSKIGTNLPSISKDADPHNTKPHQETKYYTKLGNNFKSKLHHIIRAKLKTQFQKHFLKNQSSEASG